MNIYYVDGQFVQEDRAQLSVRDLTVIRGYGVFDFLVTYNKRPFYLDEHVARLENSAKQIGLALRHSHSEICDIVLETIKQNPGHNESNIRIVCTGGIAPDGITPQGNGILLVMVTPKYQPPTWWYTDGAAVATVAMERSIPTSKNTSYLMALIAQQQAKKNEAIEAVYVDGANRVLEGTTSNFFGIKGNVIITPPDGILPGITRHVVLKLVEGHYKVELRHIDKGKLGAFSEVFLTASNKEIVPVIKIDDMVVADGHPGAVTRDIMKLFRNYTDAYGQGRVS